MSEPSLDWQKANHIYLVQSLARLRRILEQAGSDAPGAPVELPAPPQMDPPPALDRLCAVFGLAPFERDLLLMCAGVELDERFPDLFASLQGAPERTYATLALALKSLPGAFWTALAPNAPLRYWRLIEVQEGYSLTFSPVRIDERILHYLMGHDYQDRRMAGLFHVLEAQTELAPSHQGVADELAAAWDSAPEAAALPLLQVCGGDARARRDIAAAACVHGGYRACQALAAALPVDGAELERTLILWEREARLSRLALLLDCDGLEHSDPLRESAVNRLLEAVRGPLVLCAAQRYTGSLRPILTFDVRPVPPSEQADLWKAALGDQAQALEEPVREVSAMFALEPAQIRAAAGRVQAGAAGEPAHHLWNLARAQARPRLEALAQRIEPAARWGDLIVPQAQREILQDIAMQVRQRTQVYETWDFASKGQRNLGISALFAGVSGVGKTMAAEVLANELRLDLYRIDLSAVVSKYIGETEKNLRKVFDAAEAGCVILLFDEADALFGRRSEVKDSHDRYANIEVSYLLQRMEEYRGLAILTTNQKDAVDPAFLRRIRFIVQFPFPDAAQRAEIWRGIFPAALPTEALDVERLAQLNVTGGNIRTIALNAAFMATDAGQPVRMAHLLRAARHEYLKLEKPLTSAEIRGWDETEN